MVDHGEFERGTDHITLKPEVVGDYDREAKKWSRKLVNPDYKFGMEETKIPVDKNDMMQSHIENFIQCMRTRETPHLDVETGAKAVVVINLAVQSYREGKVLYWDEKKWKASDKLVRA